MEGLAAGALRVDQHAVAVEDQVRKRRPPAAAAARRAAGCGRALHAGGRDVPAWRVCSSMQVMSSFLHNVCSDGSHLCHRHLDGLEKRLLISRFLTRAFSWRAI